MSEFTEVKDSGKRQEFSTGSRRDTREGKGRFDLISPIFMARLARHLENGAVKYGDRNWEKGQPLSRYMDSAMRHLNRFLEGHRDEDHLSAVVWNIHCIIHTEEMVKRGLLPSELADLPNFLGPTAPAESPVAVDNRRALWLLQAETFCSGDYSWFFYDPDRKRYLASDLELRGEGADNWDHVRCGGGFYAGPKEAMDAYRSSRFTNTYCITRWGKAGAHPDTIEEERPIAELHRGT